MSTNPNVYIDLFKAILLSTARTFCVEFTQISWNLTAIVIFSNHFFFRFKKNAFRSLFEYIADK